MEWATQIIFTYEEVPESPNLEIGREFLRLSAGDMSYQNGLFQCGIFLSAMLPTATALRYERLEEAFVLVLADMDRGESISVRTRNDFYKLPPGSESPTNLISNLPFPLNEADRKAGGAYRGAWINATLAVATPFPKHVPNLFIHAVMENYVSNVVGMDLIKNQTVNY
jgi:hypothetical protein